MSNNWAFVSCKIYRVFVIKYELDPTQAHYVSLCLLQSCFAAKNPRLHCHFVNAPPWREKREWRISRICWPEESVVQHRDSDYRWMRLGLLRRRIRANVVARNRMKLLLRIVTRLLHHLWRFQELRSFSSKLSIDFIFSLLRFLLSTFLRALYISSRWFSQTIYIKTFGCSHNQASQFMNLQCLILILEFLLFWCW